MNEDVRLNRRELLSGIAGALTFPYVVASSALGRGGTAPASQTVATGAIGIGGRGKQILQALMGRPDCRMLAVCDVDSRRLEQARNIVNSKYGNSDCAAYADYRELLARDDIDAVLIASPDQWHVLQSVEAARAGKDMYLEKPLGLSVAEDVALREAIKRYNRVFQFGTQQRSGRNFRFACELVRNGRIGRLRTIIAATPASRIVDSYRPSRIPPQLDYEMWVGPARWMPYTQGVVGSCGNWGHLSNFSLGWITTWGIHHVDIAQWGNDADRSGPAEIEGSGKFPKDGLYDRAVAWDVKLKYANGVTLNFVDNKKERQGVLFQGDEGWVFVKRGAIEAEPKSLLNERIGPEETHLANSSDHAGNFLDCVKSRSTPVSSIDSAVRTDTVCHLSDIAMRLSRRLRWDPEAERFIDDDQANRMLSRAMRSPWHL
ncbi:MAG: Gfo/Idh/MocA family oxidoreductase [Phycisphaerales bacterium]|nr:MAG: Gfo/Idh/MocA family oxidoreductase [Phycisphaerales bacterium]